MKRVLLLLAAALMPLSAAYGADQRVMHEVAFPDGENHKVEFIQARLDEKKDLTFLGFTLEKAKFPDIIAALGKVNPVETGTDEDTDRSICYVGNDGTTIKFHGGEAAAKDTAISVEIYENHVATEIVCQGSKKVSKALSNKRGVKLGLTQAEVQKLFGEPSYKSGAEWGYTYEAKKNDPSCKAGWDIDGGYTFTFTDGKVTQFSVSQVTSC